MIFLIALPAGIFYTAGKGVCFIHVTQRDCPFVWHVVRFQRGQDMARGIPRWGVIVGVAACADLTCFADPARAEGFGLYEYGARGIALGGGMMARRADPSAIAYNPAQITSLPGTQIMVGGSVVAPGGAIESTVNGVQKTTHLRESYWALPHTYMTRQINDDWSFGVGTFSRFGLGFEYPRDWPGTNNIYEVTLLSSSLNPNLAYRVTDKLSVAAGVEALWVNLDMRKRMQAGPLTLDSNIRDATDIGWGFNVAGHYQITDAWAFGAQYRSQVRVNAHGTIRISDVATGGGIVDQRGKADASVKLPDSLAFGLSWTPQPDLSFETGAIWTRWSKFDALNININIPGRETVHSDSKKNWRDVWRLNAGVEYDALDWLSVRASYVYDQSPMPSSTQDYLSPTNDRHIWSAGAGLRWEDWGVDLTYSWVDPVSRSFKASSGVPGVVDSKMRSGYTHIVSLSASYKF